MMTRNPARPVAAALTPDEEAKVLEGIDRFIELVRDAAKIVPVDGDDTPELADRLVRWWSEQPPGSPLRPPVEDLAWAVGCATGDLLYHVLEVRWRMLAADSPGTRPRLCLIGERGDERIVLTPIDDITELIRSGEPNPATSYLDDLYEDEVVRGFIAEGDE